MARNDGSEVVAELLELAKLLEGPLFERVAYKWANEVVMPEVRANCPVRTGELLNSIELKITENGISITATAPYASYVHDGTSEEEANPFIEVAIERNIYILLDMFEAAVLETLS